jgi:hypothetical protein
MKKKKSFIAVKSVIARALLSEAFLTFAKFDQTTKFHANDIVLIGPLIAQDFLVNVRNDQVFERNGLLIPLAEEFLLLSAGSSSRPGSAGAWPLRCQCLICNDSQLSVSWENVELAVQISSYFCNP